MEDFPIWTLAWKCCLGDEAESKSKAAALVWVEGSRVTLASLKLSTTRDPRDSISVNLKMHEWQITTVWSLAELIPLPLPHG